MEPSINPTALRIFRRQMRTIGLEELAQQGRYGRDIEPGHRIPYLDILNLKRRAAKKIGNPYLGLHLGSMLQMKDYQLFGSLVENSLNLGAAVERAHRYLPVWKDGIDFNLEVRGSLALFTYHNETLPDDLRTLEGQESLFFLARYALSQLKEKSYFLHIGLMGPWPKQRKQLPIIHNRLVLHFEEAEYYLQTSRHALEEPNPGFQPALEQWILPALDHQLSKFEHRKGFLDRLYHQLQLQSFQCHDFNELASALGFSREAFLERLRREGLDLNLEIARMRMDRLHELLQAGIEDPKIYLQRLGFSHVNRMEAFLQLSFGLGLQQLLQNIQQIQKTQSLSSS